MLRNQTKVILPLKFKQALKNRIEFDFRLHFFNRINQIGFLNVSYFPFMSIQIVHIEGDFFSRHSFPCYINSTLLILIGIVAKLE